MGIYSNLCTPAKIYVVLSMISLVGVFLSNIKNPYHFSVGSYTAPLTFHNAFLGALHLLYIIVWTWILNKLCTAGLTPLSWLMVLFPILLAAVLIGLFIWGSMKKIEKKMTKELQYIRRKI
jgi:phosphoglycerol transferase MdoB-like AlkP superfamily enzyme|tara:strand:+ start:1217 stop:1579 length:363 start_codon:yes stop_codon:yes gene_type:complete